MSLSIKILLSVISAALIVFAAPPFDLWPLAFICLIPIYIALRNVSSLQAIGLGWLMGVSLFLGGTIWWVPLLERFAHMSLPAGLGLTILICAYQGLSYAIWGGLSSFFNRRFNVTWLIAGPLCMALAEIIIPFNFKMYLAITIWRVWPLTQAAEFGGPPAVSAIIVLANLLIAESIYALKERRLPEPAVRAGAIVLVIILSTGWTRALYVHSARDNAPSLKIGIVQSNFGILSLKEREHHGKKYIKALRKATVTLARQNAELIVWPESAWPYLFDRQIKKEFPPGHPWEMRGGTKGRLLFGSLTHTFGGKDVYNSSVLLTESGKVAGIYDKNRLVPFAEKIPFAGRFPEKAKKIRERTPDWPDIVPGESSLLIIDNELRIGPLICSEDIDMNYVNDIAIQKPNLLVSIASDAWFGSNGAPSQHLALASFRAIEARRDLIRATNTGVSGIVNATGKVSLEGPLMNVSGNKYIEPDLMRGDVALLDIYSPGPDIIKFFPFICIFVLIFAIVIKKGSIKRKGMQENWS